MTTVLAESERLRLREFELADVDALLGVYGDSRVTEHLSFDPFTRDKVDRFIQASRLNAEAEPRIEYALAVATRTDDDLLIGSARLAVEPHRAGQIGFALAHDVWHNGYGFELVQLLAKFGFEQLGLHRIWAARSPLNVASKRLLDKCAFVDEGRIRDHVSVSGKWRDSITCSLLEDEWRARHGEVV